MPKALVLGGSGFIGNHIVRVLLKRGYDVRVLVRPSSELNLLLDLQEVEVLNGNINNQSDLEGALEGIDVLIHAAAYYPVYSLGKSKQIAQAKRQISCVHNALRKSKCKNFVYISTLTAVGHYRDGQPEDENAPYPPKRNSSTYANLKRLMQDEVLKYADEFNTKVLAPTAVFGPRDIKPTTGRVIIEVAKNHLPLAMAGRTNVVDVRMVAKGTVDALEKGNVGRLYVLGGENMTSFKMIKRMAQVAGVVKPFCVLPVFPLYPLAWFTEIIGKLMELKAPLFPIVGLDLTRFSDHYSSEVAKQELGYEPLEIPFEKSIEDSLNWFRDNAYI